MNLLPVITILLMSLPAHVTSAPSDSHLTSRAQNLYNVLRSVASHTDQILVGKHLPTEFGLYGGHAPYWTYEHNGKQEAWMFNNDMAHANHSDELCDPCMLVNDFPAVAGFDFGLVGSDIEDAVVYLMKKAYQRGAIITYSFHADNLVSGKGPWGEGGSHAFHSIKRILPGGDHYHAFQAKMDEIAQFVKTKVVDFDGNPIPVIFRPWHEANGGWFWWGYKNDAQNTVDDIADLYRNTVTYLRDHKGIHNFLYAYSPDCGPGNMDMMDIYPGDEYVDIIGSDCYLIPNNRDGQVLKAAMDKVINASNHHNKIAALTETGVIQGSLTSFPHFYTQEILNAITSSSSQARVAYMLTWANQHTGNGKYNEFDPYPGHSMAQEYKNFYNNPKTLFLKDLKSKYPELFKVAAIG